MLNVVVNALDLFLICCWFSEIYFLSLYVMSIECSVCLCSLIAVHLYSVLSLFSLCFVVMRKQTSSALKKLCSSPCFSVAGSCFSLCLVPSCFSLHFSYFSSLTLLFFVLEWSSVRLTFSPSKKHVLFSSSVLVFALMQASFLCISWSESWWFFPFSWCPWKGTVYFFPKNASFPTQAVYFDYALKFGFWFSIFFLWCCSSSSPVLPASKISSWMRT